MVEVVGPVICDLVAINPVQRKQSRKGYATGTCLARQCLGCRRIERDRALTQSLANDNSREL